MSISFETLALAKRYTNSAVADAIGGVTSIDFQFVTSLPLAGEPGVIYCVSNGGSEPDLYDEYYYVNGRFERIPGATIDLTPYATKDWVNGEGYYKKPADGIPGTDLDDALRASIAKAETALQQHQSLAAYRTAQQQDVIDDALANVKEIEVSDTEPTDPNVSLWMYQNPGQKIEIPTMEDFRNLKPATDEQVSSAVSDWLEENISGGETIAVDKSLTVEGAAADAKVVGDLKSAFDALLTALQHVAWADDDGQTYYDAIYDILHPSPTLASITAVYTQSGTVYATDSLDSLKSDLVVTAIHSDTTSEVVTNYVLSGSLSSAVSTITVTYGGKTTTFDVNVSVNLFDPDTAAEVNLYIKTSDMQYKVGSPAYYSTYIAISPSKTYKIDKTQSAQFRVGTSQNEPANNVSVTKTEANHSGTTLTITSGANDNYLFITYDQSGSAYDDETIRNSIKIYELYGGE